ncbi:MAG: NADH-quinone oxidoreductase subunit NuoK [bacterium]|nr:NADH-quinone oxidoreductase subunit NuoK [bacterium]
MNNEVLSMFFDISLYHYLALALVLLVIGIFGTIVSKDIFKVFLSLCFIFCAVNINFLAFANFFDSVKLEGAVFSLFYIFLNFVEIIILVSIFYIMFKDKHSTDVEDYEELKG